MIGSEEQAAAVLSETAQYQDQRFPDHILLTDQQRQQPLPLQHHGKGERAHELFLLRVLSPTQIIQWQPTFRRG